MSWRRAALFGAAGTVLALAERSYGGYEIGTWAPLALVLLLVVAMLVGSGDNPGLLPWVGAAALALLGGWAAASTAWGGVPDQAWQMLDRSVLVAAALLAGALAAARRRGGVIVLAVLAAAVAQAVEILSRLAYGAPPDWIWSRLLEGPVGYHNAQASVFVVAVPLALHVSATGRAPARGASGVAAGLLIGAALLTQSRGGLGALALAVVVQVAWARSSRLALVALAATGAAAVLVSALGDVDASLAQERASHTAALRWYVVETVAASLVVAAVAVAGARFPRVRRTVLAVALAATAIAVPAVAGVAVPRAATAIAELHTDATPRQPGGETRLRSLALNGRRDAWRVAVHMGAAAPVVGAGAGSFAREWTLQRRLDELYILQPHSLELELYSELGIVGVTLFLMFLAFVIAAAVRARTRLAGAAAVAVLVALVAQASVDWTWSFAAIVAGGMLAIGALVGGRARRPAALPVRVAVPLGCVLAALAVGAPYLAHEQLALATSQQASEPTAAWLHADDALRLDPWNADALALQGLLAERARRYRVAADRYALAARVSQRPWLQWVRQARALREGGAIASSRAACRRALLGNPGEWRLRHEPPCEGVAVPGPS